MHHRTGDAQRSTREGGVYSLSCKVVLGWGGVLMPLHGRSRMTIRPSRPYNSRTEHVAFSPMQTLLAPNAKRRDMASESHE